MGVEAGVAEGVLPISEESEGSLDDLFRGVPMANIDHFVAPPGADGWRGDVRHQLGEGLHGAEGGCAKSERFFEAASDGIEAHGRVELSFDGVQFLNPAGETFRAADGEAHRGIVQVGMRVDETRQEGYWAEGCDGGGGSQMLEASFPRACEKDVFVL